MNIGIIGLGHIARKMGDAVLHTPEANGYAVASRDYGKAQAFKEEFSFQVAYGSYEELLEDEQVELVYIATPHSLHYEQAKKCLEHGKHVLCEKTFTQYLWQAEELFQLAEEKHLFLMEARMVPFMPMTNTLQKLLYEEQVIGEPMSLMANVSYPLTHKERVMQPSLAGGGLMDIGVYPLEVARLVFGTNENRVSSHAVMSDTGVDAQVAINLEYPNGKLACLMYSINSVSNGVAVITGTEGCIEVQDFNHMQEIRVYNKAHECVNIYRKSEQISDLSYELIAAIHAIQDGKTECEELPKSEILRVLRLMDQLQKEWNE